MKLRRAGSRAKLQADYYAAWESGQTTTATDTPAAKAAPPNLLTPGILLIVTALLTMIAGYRLNHRGLWLPPAPAQIGAWTATEMPLSESARQMLGDPPTEGMRYTNPFNERVEAHVIATASFDAYHEPSMTQTGRGFTQTAERNIPLFGKDKYVRALILKNDQDGERVLLYYWVQYPNGDTSTRKDVTDYRNVFPRLTLGWQTALDGQQNCIVRAYTQVHPADPHGVQARRNLNQVAIGLYNAFSHKNVAANSGGMIGSDAGSPDTGGPQ